MVILLLPSTMMYRRLGLQIESISYLIVDSLLFSNVIDSRLEVELSGSDNIA